MKIELRRRDDDSWDLLVDGQVKIEAESFAIADGVKYALEHPDYERVVCGELHEVADVIRKAEVKL